MGKYVMEVEITHFYQYVFDAETDAEANEIYDNYIMEDKDLMHSEVTGMSLERLKDSTGAYL
jgi:hypothetical protein